ncbi:MAG: tRNA (adenosine(37)-N6)-threonylcarbamoyltransferase complex ATPase subunit type 1 TsaE [Ndongobacter sp.]|nr:tRNA (adenosine(37)-N6)-threonylcarbamoyltransferase complex ATPase subunit type 1 TsaE [Ndongobacter sp.]
MKFETKEQTKKFARHLAAALKPGDVFRLDGDLGAGKTTLVQWVSEARSVREAVVSPTFSLVRRYDSDLGTINHLDLYRIEDPQEIEELDYEELFYPEQGVTFIEWAQRAEEYLPSDIVCLNIDKCGDEAREITVTSTGERAGELRRVLFGGEEPCA